MSQLKRRQAFPLFGSFVILAIALVVATIGYAGTPGASAQAQRVEPGSHFGNFDFFTTSPKGTYFDFTGELALPAGFFDKESPRFEGRVPFKGVPIRTFQGHKTANTDTIVERKSMPKLGSPFPSRGAAEVELVDLSLASLQPIQLRVGKRIQKWDVRLLLSSHRPSVGKMTIVQENERGGVFDSEFIVFPILKFVRLGDGAERVLDVGGMNLGPEGIKKLTLHANSAPWETRTPKDALRQSGDFFAGVKGGHPAELNHGKHVTRYSTLEHASPL